MTRKLLGDRPKNPRIQLQVSEPLHEKMMIVAKARGQESAEMIREIVYPFIAIEFQKLVDAGLVGEES